MPTAAQLLDLDGVSRRSSTIRYDLLDATLTKIGEIDAPDREQPPAVTNNVNRTIKRTMDNLVLPPSVEADVDTIADRIRPMWLVGGEEFECGVFLWADASRRRRSYGLHLDGALIDQTLILDQPLHYGVSYPEGISITAAIDELTTDIPNRSISPSSYQIGNPVAWPVGTSRFQILAELCAMIGYFSPYFDNGGTMVVRPATDLASVAAEHTYEAGGRIVDGTIVESDDLLDAPNLYVVIGSGANDAEVYGTFEVPDEAPYSLLNRGFYVTDVWESQGITDSAQAAATAAARYASDSSTYRWVEFESTPDPRHDTFGVVQFLGALYREQEWVLTLREGVAMRHSLRRIYGSINEGSGAPDTLGA